MDDPPLAGFTVAVTAARRRKELSALLARRGARVVEAPAIRIVSTHDDDQLRGHVAVPRDASGRRRRHHRHRLPRLDGGRRRLGAR